MDTFCHLHRMFDAVRDSLARAGLDGFKVWRVDDPKRWFNLGWFTWFLERRRRHRELPLWDGGRATTPFETRDVYSDGNRRRIRRLSRDGVVHVVGDCLVAVISFIEGYGGVEEIVIAGEKRAGAFQKLLDAYGLCEVKWARASKWIEVIGGASIPRPSGMTWNDVVLPEKVREDLRLQVESFFAAGALYRKLGIPYRRGLLFTGPPGNGKTSILRVIASTRTEPFVWMTGEPGSEDERLGRAIDRAIVLAPSILCLEDVDSLLTKDGSLSQFLNRLDGLAPLEGVLILATTNHPDELDEAVTHRPSRFDRIFVFDNPAPAERRLYLKKLFGSAFDERLVAKSDGHSYAQLKEAWVSACLEAVHAGRSDPTVEAALRAFNRAGDTRVARMGDWASTRPVGFQRPVVSNRNPQDA